MTCEYCGHPVVEEEWDNDQVIVINPERAKSPVVDTKVVHKECKEEADRESKQENLNAMKPH